MSILNECFITIHLITSVRHSQIALQLPEELRYV
jgi:hypothetical protein